MTSTYTETLRARYDEAKTAAEAARVPDDDLAGPGSEPVAISGWYDQPTVSGCRAWTRYDWREGVCIRGRSTYDLAAERRATDAHFAWAEADWLAQGAAVGE